MDFLARGRDTAGLCGNPDVADTPAYAFCTCWSIAKYFLEAGSDAVGLFLCEDEWVRPLHGPEVRGRSLIRSGGLRPSPHPTTCFAGVGFNSSSGLWEGLGAAACFINLHASPWLYGGNLQFLEGRSTGHFGGLGGPGGPRVRADPEFQSPRECRDPKCSHGAQRRCMRSSRRALPRRCGLGRAQAENVPLPIRTHG